METGRNIHIRYLTMGSLEDKRFQIAWLSVILMLGIAILLGYFGLGLYAGGAFLLGLGLIVLALSFGMGKRETLQIGLGGLLAVAGAAILLINIGANLPLVIGGILAGAALAAIVYLIAKK